MTDGIDLDQTGDLLDLARRAGIEVDWTDAFGGRQQVSREMLTRVLGALGFACDSASEIVGSIASLRHGSGLPPLITADAGAEVVLPLSGGRRGYVEIDLPTGTVRPGTRRRRGRAVFHAPAEPGYHRMRIGSHEAILAVAPARCRSVLDLTGKAKASGAAAQIYGLRRQDRGGVGDGGIGDFGAVGELAEALAAHGADALAISPTHALFTAEPARPSPYAPSSRLVLNPLLADPSCLFDAADVAASWAKAAPAGRLPELERETLIDWAEAGSLKLAMLRALFAGPGRHHPAFADYLGRVRQDVVQHAIFETIHARQKAEHGRWHWRDWPEVLRRPSSPGVADFAQAHADEVSFHIFLQWLAEASIDHAQARALQAGMGIGLIADLAVGMDPSGSHAWSRPQDILEGLSIGAPPDLINRDGQSWGLTGFSPTALRAEGFAPFLATLRAALRHAGGVRIDHIMGLRRLWLVPDGMPATQGAYLTYPLQDFLRLIALESHLNDAVIVGEDLGTVPPGFREQLSARGILGMRVLPFERAADGGFLKPERWQRDALAMTSTHDIPPIAGWWTGRDLVWRAALKAEPAAVAAADAKERRADCARFWNAAVNAGVAEGAAPDADAEGADAAVDAAIAYVTASDCEIAIIPMEDLLGLTEGPNLPGTVDEHPNWRRRLHAPATDLLADARVTRRLARLHREPKR